MMRFADWEVQTIEALAREALEKMDARDEYVQFPERFVERFITDTQARCSAIGKNTAGERKDAERERRRLGTQAQRLGIGNAHPPRVGEHPAEPYEVATDEMAGRWVRLIGLVFREPFDSDWRLLHDDVVTQQVASARASGRPWRIEHGGIGQLELLETEALEMGLISGDAPRVDGAAAVRAMARAIAGIA